MGDNFRHTLRYPQHLMNRRTALKSIGLGTTALTLSSCGIIVGSPPAGITSLGKDPAPGRKVNIELYSVFGSQDAAHWIKLAEIYEQIQPDVGVKITHAPSPNSSGGDNPKLFTAIAGNNSPDLAHITPFSTPQWVELGIMTDLTPYFERDGLSANDFWPVEWHDMTYKGKVWQVNWDTDPNFPFFWNKDLFEKAGLDPDKPPQTIDEVDEYSKKINSVSGGNVIQIGMIPWSVYGYANSMFTWGWAFGGEFYDEEKREVTPDNEYVVKALEWMVNYAKSVGGADRVNIQPPNVALPAFATGMVGMAPLVSANRRQMMQTSPNLHMGATLLPYQAPGATQPGSGAWLGGWSLFIPRGAKHPDEAWNFIKWVCASDQGTAAEWNTVSDPPCYTKAPILENIKNDSIMGPYYETIITAKHSRPNIPVGAFYVTQLEQLVSAAIYGQMTPLQALRQVKQNTMQEWDRFRRELGLQI
jgi:multiple sugar transport system substrate-binding protein